ncbi:DUF2806 domain-containing protein [Citrobacter sp. wls758]|uniref:DUF2806 domain-containing protein n=1 Tax=Citrobacter sp. wls758 TaxID=2576416 RepID=UPI0010C9784E|nr:DUF2806 domain-containing protein [Citrobacter sp. wls758]TKU29525.1 DUF2806 domain-containing protein [Citrobacter sp. wls758]
MSLSKLAEKLWDTVGANGISALCKPGQIRREGIAGIEVKRKEMLILAQTEKEIEDIKNGKAIVSLTDFNNPKIISLEGENDLDSSGKMEPYINIENLTKTISTQLVAHEIQKEINIAKSLFVAEDILSQDQSAPTNENIEDDWLVRWRDSAATSSSEKLQDLWGRVLAGELKTPGTYSLRTIDFIKNLTQKEAIKIQKLFSFVLFGRVLKAKDLADGFNNEYLDNELTFNFLSELQSLGVLAGVESMGLSTTFKSNDNSAYSFHDVYNDKIIHVTHEDPKKTLTFNVFILTPLGHELRSLCPATIDIKYINHVVDIIKKQGFKVVIGEKFISSDGSLSYINGVEV